MKNTKKVLAGVLCVATVAASTTAFAGNSWKFKGYSTEDWNVSNGVYNKMWYEVDARGIPTGREKYEGVASKVEWKHEFYERDYPHAEVNRLYLDEQATEVLGDSGAFADWEMKYEPEMWEVQYPYRIYERLKTNIPGIGWYANTLEHRGVTEADLLKYLGKNEPVTQTYEYFGFGPYRIINKDVIEQDNYRPGKEQALYNGHYWYEGATDLDGNYIVDSSKLLDDFGIDSSLPFYEAYCADCETTTPHIATDVVNDNECLSCWNAWNGYDVSNAKIANNIHVFKSEYLVGKDYVKGGNQKIDTATYYTKTLNAGMFNPHFIIDTNRDNVASIAWTNEMYEHDYVISHNMLPNKQYQYLIVDGVILDGRRIGTDWSLGTDPAVNGIYLPTVYRYVGNVLGYEQFSSDKGTYDGTPDMTNNIQNTEDKALNNK